MPCVSTRPWSRRAASRPFKCPGGSGSPRLVVETSSGAAVSRRVARSVRRTRIGASSPFDAARIASRPAASNRSLG